MNTFTNYHQWREAITKEGGFTLDRDYCEKRITALKNEKDQGTQSFVKAYGVGYRDQVVLWFKQALSET